MAIVISSDGGVQSKKSGTIIDADMLLARRSEGGQCLQHHQLSFFYFFV